VFVLASISIVSMLLAACTPASSSLPSTPPTAAPATGAAPIPSPARAAAASPSAQAGAAVQIIEPPFRQPQEWTYVPAELSVKAGTAVTWTNMGAVAHTVTADDGTSFDSATIDPKATFNLVLSVAGTFAYHCTFHPWMKGTLAVTP
jgi:plastocyanin